MEGGRSGQPRTLKAPHGLAAACSPGRSCPLPLEGVEAQRGGTRCNPSTLQALPRQALLRRRPPPPHSPTAPPVGPASLTGVTSSFPSPSQPPALPTHRGRPGPRGQKQTPPPLSLLLGPPPAPRVRKAGSALRCCASHFANQRAAPAGPVEPESRPGRHSPGAPCTASACQHDPGAGVAFAPQGRAERRVQEGCGGLSLGLAGCRRARPEIRGRCPPWHFSPWGLLD